MANVIGQRVRRREDPRFLRGEGRYVDNIKLEDELYVVFVRSPMAHARIVELDVSAARDLPGVKVFTDADTTLESSPPPPFIGIDPQMFRPGCSQKSPARVNHPSLAFSRSSRVARQD